MSETASWHQLQPKCRFSSSPEGYYVLETIWTEVYSPRKERGPLLIFKIGPIAHITPH
ncbi:hypothetical protein NEUTE2DRAFT_142741 [Neurospora tetrasperma FGSC 2509]|nr:hypothetical protein NEUTE2DRAFT_142741 [Neurospora tetrasperma FGSC 2509]